MKKLADWMVQLGFIWVGFWLTAMDPKMCKQLQRALDDGLSKYSEK